jgi:hypothetical protein
MVPKFKNSILFRTHLVEAAKKRVLDVPFVKYSNKELQQLSLQVVRNLNSLQVVQTRQGLPINSVSEREFLKNFKYFTYLMNAKIISLEELLEADSIESSANVKEIQRELVALDTEVEEKEIELLGNYSEVHLNTFSRTKDAQLQYSDKSWLVDFKTGVTYREKYLMNPAGPGSMTNPLRTYQKVVVKDAVVVDELSDAGDSAVPIQKSNPRNIFREGKIFRYVVARKEFDSSGRRYKSQTSLESYPYSCTSTMTVQLELANLMQINTLKINPLGDSTVFIKDIRYVSESGEEVSLSTVSINAQTDIVILFEPILTKYLIVQFEQKAHVEKTEIVSVDERVSAINSKLAAKGFVNRLAEVREPIQGRVYDFSLENMEVGLSVYETKGVFRALPVRVSSPIGMEMQKVAENIVPTTSLEKDYFGSYSVIPEDAALLEAYVGVRLWDKQENKRVDSIVPVLDSGLTQREILAPIAAEARFKLFPELQYTEGLVCIEDLLVEKVCKEDIDYYDISRTTGSGLNTSGGLSAEGDESGFILSNIENEVTVEGTNSAESAQNIIIEEKQTLGQLLEETSEFTPNSESSEEAEASEEVCTYMSIMKITFDKVHNLSLRDTLTIVSENESINGIELVVYHVIDERTIYVAVNTGLLSYWTSAENPEACVNSAVNIDSIKVYENRTLLTYGKDYEISIDDKSTWRTEAFSALEIQQLVKPRAAAGRFYIKLLNYDPAKYYWTEYIVERNQALSSCKKIRLKNGRVVFDTSLRSSQGTLQSIIISRTSSNNTYLTAVVREYSLAIQARNIENSSSGKVIKAGVLGRRVGALSATQ